MDTHTLKEDNRRGETSYKFAKKVYMRTANKYAFYVNCTKKHGETGKQGQLNVFHSKKMARVTYRPRSSRHLGMVSYDLFAH